LRVLIVSGIHGNLRAFRAVLQDAEGKWDVVWSLGNIIGYGPEPNECMELFRSLPHRAVLGGHENFLLGRWTVEHFDPIGNLITVEAQAALWTQKVITPAHVSYMATLPKQFVVKDYLLVHGTHHNEYDYIIEENMAALTFPHFETAYCLSGHSTVPAIYSLEADGTASTAPLRYGEPYLLHGQRRLITPGCVGISYSSYTPVDQANYALLDVDRASFEFCRCPYDFEGLLSQLRSEGFPAKLIRGWENGWLE